ncbi:hypothetical protein HNY73_007356 [Argiope bruennichi]|uniref:Helitron helicase-like domain-containing protein n=1 Tax=Argiope bruennichi TaxID=94029 RepID=A0A8T0FGR2_ARGBR|nr:hypothetical protein HNY73_007356 [Argiope bruennichi]
MGSLLPMPNEPHKFLQIYFMGGEDSGSALANRVNARCDYNNLDSLYARRIVSELDALLNEHNELLKIFKSHMHQLQSDNHAIVINPDKTPAGEHIRRFNAPVVDDVAGIMVGDCTAAREILIRRRNNNLQFIADTHRSYDALQYPLIFWKGQDGYCINIKQRDPVSGAETNKNVSSKDYYAYRLMIRRGLDNVILRCRELCQQFMVDMSPQGLTYYRSYFQREDKRARLPSGSAALDIAPKWVHYHRLLFLRDTIYVGSSESNLDDSFATDGCSEPMEADHFEAYEENCPESSAATPQKRVAESSNNSVGPPPKRRRQTNVGEDVLRMVSEVLKKKVKLRNLFPMRWDNLLFPL